eukprot:scaffold1213_cov256-Pinguiococcus_pyrenoidosus.AAC.3
MPVCQALMAFLVRKQPEDPLAEALGWLATRNHEDEALEHQDMQAKLLQPGSECHARYQGSSSWFAAKVQEVDANGTYALLFDDGDRERGVPFENVRPVPTFAEGQEIEAKYQGKGKWLPGRIEKDQGMGQFLIAYDDGDKEIGVPLLCIQARDQPDPVKPGSLFVGLGRCRRERELLRKLQAISNVEIVVLGLEGVGKTTMLKALQGDREPRGEKSSGGHCCTCFTADLTPPTMSVMPSGGFKPVKLNVGRTKATFFDLGGRQKLRGIWANYYHDVHACVFVLDGAAEPEAFTESLRQLKRCMNHHFLKFKPVLILANKEDLPEARSSNVIRRQLHSAVGVQEGPLVRIFDCVAFPPLADADGAADPRLQEGIGWLMETVADRSRDLFQRVAQDKLKIAEEQKIAQKERERRVFSRTLRKAFPEAGQSKEECMEPAEGLEFLAMETGLSSPTELAPDARFLARAVGYEKLALQMMGAMRVPISSKTKAMTWAEIRDYVFEIREELNIPEDELGKAVDE